MWVGGRGSALVALTPLGQLGLQRLPADAQVLGGAGAVAAVIIEAGADEALLVGVHQRVEPTPGGGLGPADTMCEQEADDAGFDGNFLALLATSFATAADYFNADDGPWVRPDGVRVFSERACARGRSTR